MEVKYNVGSLLITLPTRIDAKNAAAFEKELFAVEQLHDAEEILLDAKNLAYISSLGLRVILKLAKKIKTTPTLMVNASNEVYNVFDVTGMTSFIKVLRKRRSVNLTSTKLLAFGMFGSVYRVNEEQILKVFYDLTTERKIQEIVDTMRIAFTHGIPTILPFEVVKTEKGFGILLELLNAQVLSTLMHDNPKDFDRHVIEMVKLAKTLADTEFEEYLLKNRNDFMTEVVESAAEYLTPEEISVLKSYVDLVPRRNSGVHGDLHARNIMITDGKPFLIDMDEFGCGHPVWDIAGTHLIYQMIPHFPEEIFRKQTGLEGISLADFYFKMIRFTFDEADICWEKFFNEYFNDYSAREKNYILQAVKFYSRFKLIIFSIARCHVEKNNSTRLAMQVDVIRYYLKEMQAFDIGKLIKAFEVWK